MEKRKILQEEKDDLDNKKTRNQEATLTFESIQNQYDTQIKLLQEQLQILKIERNISEKAQKQAMRELEREYKLEKKQKLQNLEQLIKNSSDLIN